MRPAISYARISSEMQSRGTGLKGQQEAIEAFCKRHKLDLTTNMVDGGFSAYKGEHTKFGELGAFLEKLKRGKVPTGSVLVIAKIDRLSRDDVLPALNLMANIIKAGVDIGVTDNDKIYGIEQLRDTNTIMMLVMQFATANEESRKKQDRTLTAWRMKRANAKNTPMTGKGPCWLTLTNGKWVINEHAKTIKLIYKMALSGYGGNATIRELNKRGIKSISGLPIWTRTTITNILKNKATIGIFTPRINLKPQEPIEGYYPPIISNETFYKVQNISRPHYRKKGRTGENVPNLFSGLLVDPTDNDNHYIMTTRESGCKVLITQNMKLGITKSKNLNYAMFEEGMLTALRELEINDIISDVEESNEAIEEIETISGELIKVSAKIDKLNTLIADSDDIDTFATALQAATGRKKILMADLERAKAKATTSQVGTLKEATTIIQALAKAKDKLQARTACRTMIRQLIKVVEVTVDDGERIRKRGCTCIITFHSGTYIAIRLDGIGNVMRIDADVDGVKINGRSAKEFVEQMDT